MGTTKNGSADADQYWRKPTEARFPEISGLSEFVREVEDFAKPRERSDVPESEINRLLFRGASDKTHGLRSSLGRHMWGGGGGKQVREYTEWTEIPSGKADIGWIEHAGTDEFKRRAPSHVEDRSLEHMDAGAIPCWWQLMQHHGAPTRLLDWTASPYVAAFFACKGEKTDGVIWMVDSGALIDRTTAHLRSKDQSFSGLATLVQGRLETIPADETRVHAPGLYFERCGIRAPRAHLQQSWFSCPAIASVDHDWAIEELLRTQESKDVDWRGWWTRKVIVPRDAKPKLLRSLWQMNITGESLFPGLDGLGQTIAILPQLIRPDGDLRFHWENGLLSQQREEGT